MLPALKDFNDNRWCVCRNYPGLTKSVTDWRQKRSLVCPVDADWDGSWGGSRAFAQRQQTPVRCDRSVRSRGSQQQI